eukprot:1136313-Pelagomonas_calceolata.AAC.7
MDQGNKGQTILLVYLNARDHTSRYRDGVTSDGVPAHRGSQKHTERDTCKDIQRGSQVWHLVIPWLEWKAQNEGEGPAFHGDKIYVQTALQQTGHDWGSCINCLSVHLITATRVLQLVYGVETLSN